jgi:hypothetical protein
MMRPKPSSITVMHLMPMTACGITTADTKFLKGRPIRTRWKGITPSCGITWRDWQDRRVVSRDVPMRLIVLCVCLSSATTGDNSISNFIRLILLILRISLTHYFSHSLKKSLDTFRKYMIYFVGSYQKYETFITHAFLANPCVLPGGKAVGKRK